VHAGCLYEIQPQSAAAAAAAAGAVAEVSDVDGEEARRAVAGTAE